MRFIETFQDYAVPVALGLIALLGAMVAVLLIVYLVSAYRHNRERAYVQRNKPRWQRLIVNLLTGKLNPEEAELDKRGRCHVRDFMLDAFFHHELDTAWSAEIEQKSFAEMKSDPSYHDKVRELYVKLGFLDDDLDELNDHRWWRRVKAIERLDDLGIPDGEEEILARLADRRSEVRFTALRYLALTGSKRIHAEIPGVFSASSTWSYLYLVNILYQANLPLKVLEDLVKSENPFQRKAAATLLGQKTGDKTISILAKLTEDAVPEVRREAVFSLARIGSAAAIPVFWRRVADESSQVRAAIAKGIGDLGHLVLLQDLADDDEFEVRFQAFASLSKLGVVGREVISNYQGKYTDLAREFLVEVNHA